MSLEPLFISETEDTPEVNFNTLQGRYSIAGRSLPEDSMAFYEPIIRWLDVFSKEDTEDVCFEFYMEYFNTSSAKQIAKILLLLERLNERVFVQIIWKYKLSDNDMMSSGMRFSKLLNLEFELRGVE